MNKKMLPICTLKILERFSDEKHPLMQKDIIAFLKKYYDLEIERKALSRMLNELMEMDYDIIYQNGYYLGEREFSNSELNFLIDSILSSSTLTPSQADSMIKKLIDKESNYQKRKYTHIHNVSDIAHGRNTEFFLTVECIEEAIELSKKISFDYMSYGLDKQLHKKREESYIVSPYEMLVSQGRYYLLGNYDKYNNLSHYRIDKIKNIRILDEIRKPIESLEGYQQGFQYPRHLIEHIYMFSGPSKKVTIKFDHRIIDQIIDWFGKDCVIEPYDETHSLLKVRVNLNALTYWLKQYDDFTELMESVQ